MAALDKNGLTENTLLIFTSDNGCSPAAGIKELEAQDISQVRIGGETKRTCSKAGTAFIPNALAWKDQSWQHSDQVICLTDLMATCADIVGAKLPATAGEDSVSLLPAMNGKAQEPLHEAVVHHSINGSFAIRQGQWKLILCADSGGWSEPKPNSKDAKGLLSRNFTT